jgi:glycyl-tRNA synthetase
VLALICEAFDEETLTDDKGKEDIRTVLRFKPTMAPIKVGIFPHAQEERGAGPHRQGDPEDAPEMDARFLRRRWSHRPPLSPPGRSRHAICVTVDFDTLGENGDELKDTVTIRHRDSMEQERLPISGLLAWLLERVR